MNRQQRLWKKSILIAIITLVLLGTGSSDAYAWMGEKSIAIKLVKNVALSYDGVHYTRTLQWAADKGFNAADAQAIAVSCLNVDKGEAFFDKCWHLGTGWQYGAMWPTLDTSDSRVQKAVYCLNSAIDCKNSGDMQSAMNYLGNGLHAVQDYYSHMNAGSNASTTYNLLSPFHHGEIGTTVDVYFSVDGSSYCKFPYQAAVENLYDSVNMDYAPIDNGTMQWVYSMNPEENSRLLNTEAASKAYMDDFINSNKR
ncbi:MAG: hypothetical protein ACM3NJ_00505 [Methanobacterium sp.]